MDFLKFDDLPKEAKQKLLDEGRKKLRWAEGHMPVLNQLGGEIAKRGSLKGTTVAMALHTEAKTGVLALTLARCGAKVRLASCNPLSTDDPVAYALKFEHDNLEVLARYGESNEDYYRALNWALDIKPQVVVDDGGDLVKLLHTERKELLEHVIGGCEETTTGIVRLKALAAEGRLRFPVMDVNDCAMKHFFDNRYGTGQSSVDGIMSATNLSIAGMRCLVAGYGWCGKGIAMRLKGMGANVTVAEVDPIKGVEAAMDGFRVGKVAGAAKEANLIITATGCKGIVGREVIDVLPDGCLVANSGHFDNEIDINYLKAHSRESFEARKHVTAFRMKDGRTIYLLAEGRLVNLVAGQGHPAEIMDMSFAIQAAGVEMIAAKGKNMPKEVIMFPAEMDEKVASLKLKALGYSIDRLSDAQKKYLSSWEEGT